jgi:hypothetical protein
MLAILVLESIPLIIVVSKAIDYTFDPRFLGCLGWIGSGTLFGNSMGVLSLTVYGFATSLLEMGHSVSLLLKDGIHALPLQATFPRFPVACKSFFPSFLQSGCLLGTTSNKVSGCIEFLSKGVGDIQA